jgi:hypothetical protein
MSKKLIAVAAAAALALTGLVAAPASANTFGVAVLNASALPTGQTSQTGDTAGTAFNIIVPTADVVRVGDSANGTNTTTTALRVTVTKSASAATVTATATGGALIYTDTSVAANSKTAGGVKTLTDNTNAATSVFHIATTSTAASSVVFSDSNGNSKTIFVKGTSTFVYKIDFTASTTVAPKGAIVLTGTAKDAWGNNVVALEDGDFKITAVGGSVIDAGTIAPADFDYDTTTGVYTIEHLARDDAGQMALSLEIAAAEHKASKVTAFGDLALSQFFTVNASDLTAAVAALQAQVAALQAIVDRKVKKKRFNTLARKWNAAFPSQAVKLKK